MIILLFFLLFALISVIYVFDFKNTIVKNIVIIGISIILILVAGLREKGMDSDYYVYRNFWRTRKLLGNVEYSFYILRNFIKNTLALDFQSLLLVFAFLGVSVKVSAIRLVSPVLWGSMLIYFSHYFILHEFTQIRIGVATGFVLFSIYFLSGKKYILYFIFALLAIFFHQSCVVVLLFPLIKNARTNILVFTLLIPLGYILYFLNTYFNVNIPIPGLQDKIDLYEEATESGFLKDSKINAFNALFLIRVFIFYVLFFYSKKISPFFPGFYIFFKVYALSLFSFLFLSKIPVFSFRIQELLGVVEILLIPSIIFLFSNKFSWIGKLSVWIISLAFLLLNIFYVKLIIVK